MVPVGHGIHGPCQAETSWKRLTVLTLAAPHQRSGSQKRSNTAAAGPWGRRSSHPSGCSGRMPPRSCRPRHDGRPAPMLPSCPPRAGAPSGRCNQRRRRLEDPPVRPSDAKISKIGGLVWLVIGSYRDYQIIIIGPDKMESTLGPSGTFWAVLRLFRGPSQRLPAWPAISTQRGRKSLHFIHRFPAAGSDG